MTKYKAQIFPYFQLDEVAKRIYFNVSNKPTLFASTIIGKSGVETAVYFGNLNNGKFIPAFPFDLSIPEGVRARQAVEIEAKAFGDLEKYLTLIVDGNVIKKGMEFGGTIH